ncbi:hypothetical protein Droror1_Dr00006222 [Drosera rotundifolia]
MASLGCHHEGGRWLGFRDFCGGRKGDRRSCFRRRKAISRSMWCGGLLVVGFVARRGLSEVVDVVVRGGWCVVVETSSPRYGKAVDKI